MGDAWIEQATFSVSRNCDTASPIALAPQPGIEPGTKRLTVVRSTAELLWNVALNAGQTFTRKGFKGTDLMGTLSEAGGVSLLYPGKHLAGTLNDYIRT